MPGHLSDNCSRLLEFQRGVIARWQAAAVGLDPATIDNLLRRDRWQPLYRGVYAAFTGDPSRERLLWAAVLRSGAGAVLSHRTAAELDGLADNPSEVIHVTVGHDRRVRISDAERRGLAPRVVVHRTDRIDTIRHPVRTPPRTRVEETVLDLAQTAKCFDDAFAWLCRGCSRRLVTPQLLRTAAGRRSRMRWREEMMSALGSVADGVHSNLEYRYVRDVEKPHGLPTATRQLRIVREARSQYLDNLYAPFAVVVELDGQATHLAEDRWRDIHRDNHSARSGITTLRYNWSDVTTRHCEVAAQIAAVLRLRGWDGTLRSCGPACTVAATAATAGATQPGRLSGPPPDTRPR
jgi:very-short-patch-repair endonuclease